MTLFHSANLKTAAIVVLAAVVLMGCVYEPYPYPPPPPQQPVATAPYYGCCYSYYDYPPPYYYGGPAVGFNFGFGDGWHGGHHHHWR